MHLTAVIHYKNCFPTKAASECPMDTTVTAYSTMNFLCKSLKMWVCSREIQKEPNSQHTLSEEQLLLKADQKLL